MKKIVRILLCFLLLFPLLTAAGEEAPDITSRAVFSGVPAIDKPGVLFDNRHISTWASRKGYLEITLPPEEPCFGVYLCFRDHATVCEIQVAENGAFRPVHRIGSGGYAHQFIPLPGVTCFRIAAKDPEEIMTISELRLIGNGTVPSYIQQWEPPLEKADLMLITAHPDDEYIWFGGTIPYYAKERNKKIQVVTMTCMTAYRKSELLDALWTGGIRYYPVIGPFEDRKTDGTESATNAWGGSRKIKDWLVTVIRTHRPDVVLTHAENGEYGHPAHIITSRYARESLRLAADETFETREDTKPWQVSKGYVHYGEQGDPITIGWDMPLEDPDGRTAFDLAGEALLKHRSQHPLSQQMEQKGRYDCRKFVLDYSVVGEDKLKNDFFENIP